MTPTDTRPYQTAASRRARQRQLLIGTAVVATLAVIGALGWRWWQNRGVPVVADRVLVTPLEVADPSLEGLARDFAALPVAIAREGVGAPVPASTVRDLLGGWRGSSAEQPNYLARRTGAGLVLRSSCALQGSTTACQLELLRMPGKVLRLSVTVKGTFSDPAFGARLQEQALVMLLLQQRWGDRATWAGEYVSPSLAAVRAFIRGFEAWARERSDTMTGHWYREAARLDPEWITALVAISADMSALQTLAARPGMLESEREAIDAAIAARAPNADRWYEVVASRHAKNPEFWLWDVVTAAARSERARAVLRVAPLADSLSPEFSMVLSFSYDEWSEALHRLGRYDEQLAVAAKVRTRVPNQAGYARRYEMRARAALGEVEEVRRILAESEAEIQDHSTTGTLAFSAALELMAHGHPVEGRALLATTLPFYRRAREQRGDLAFVDNEIQALEWTGALDSARTLAQRMAGAGDAEQLRYGGGRRKLGWFLGSLGSIAARQGHREEALLYSARLEEWDRQLRDAGDVNGEAAYFRAVIATQLGDREEAIRLLQLAIPLNPRTLHVRHRWIHIDPGLAPLHGYPPFEALLQPKE